LPFFAEQQYFTFEISYLVKLLKEDKILPWRKFGENFLRRKLWAKFANGWETVPQERSAWSWTKTATFLH
jgi:hypothetical protein